jgi:ATP-dependent Lon protease
MTGEITLRGRILPIGGLKEKCIATLRTGINNIIIPKGNEKDLGEIPDYVKEKINFKIVSDMSEVIDYALIPVEKDTFSKKEIGIAHRLKPSSQNTSDMSARQN